MSAEPGEVYFCAQCGRGTQYPPIEANRRCPTCRKPTVSWYTIARSGTLGRGETHAEAVKKWEAINGPVKR